MGRKFRAFPWGYFPTNTYLSLTKKPHPIPRMSNFGKAVTLDPEVHTINMVKCKTGKNEGRWFYSYDPSEEGKGSFLAWNDYAVEQDKKVAVQPDPRFDKWIFPRGVVPSALTKRVFFKTSGALDVIPKIQPKIQPSQTIQYGSVISSDPTTSVSNVPTRSDPVVDAIGKLTDSITRQTEAIEKWSLTLKTSLMAVQRAYALPDVDFSVGEGRDPKRQKMTDPTWEVEDINTE